jgi:hypothetical protein
MKSFESRKYNRFEAFKLTSFNCLDENDEAIHHGMGRTLNVSKSGICLETHVPIDTRYKLSMAMGIDDNLVDINGRVVYCDTGKDKMYECGIEFMGIDEDTLQILNDHIVTNS